MNREVLEQPFAPKLVRTRKGSFGQELSYVEGVEYIRRLNEAFDGQWSWRILSHEVRDADVVVQGVLEAGGVEKHAFGGTSVTVNGKTGEVISIADDLKAASTDALKKACSLLGVGLDLYAPTTDGPTANGGTRPAQGKQPDQRRAESAPRDGQGNGSGERNRLTARQLKAIYAIGHAEGRNDADLRRECLDTYGVAPEFLTRVDASNYITQLSASAAA